MDSPQKLHTSLAVFLAAFAYFFNFGSYGLLVFTGLIVFSMFAVIWLTTQGPQIPHSELLLSLLPKDLGTNGHIGNEDLETLQYYMERFFLLLTLTVQLIAGGIGYLWRRIRRLPAVTEPPAIIAILKSSFKSMVLKLAAVWTGLLILFGIAFALIPSMMMAEGQSPWGMVLVFLVFLFVSGASSGLFIVGDSISNAIFRIAQPSLRMMLGWEAAA